MKWLKSLHNGSDNNKNGSRSSSCHTIIHTTFKCEYRSLLSGSIQWSFEWMTWTLQLALWLYAGSIWGKFTFFSAPPQAKRGFLEIPFILRLGLWPAVISLPKLTLFILIVFVRLQLWQRDTSGTFCRSVSSIRRTELGDFRWYYDPHSGIFDPQRPNRFWGRCRNSFPRLIAEKNLIGF